MENAGQPVPLCRQEFTLQKNLPRIPPSRATLVCVTQSQHMNGQNTINVFFLILNISPHTDW